MSRSLKKGPYVDEKLMRRVLAMNQGGRKEVLRTWSRDSTIFPEMVGHTIAVHDGRRLFRGHTARGEKSTGAR
jgi:small subunit ribosomal protein S19